jgi:hypothetical protein
MQLNIKASPDTIRRFIAISDAYQWPSGLTRMAAPRLDIRVHTNMLVGCVSQIAVEVACNLLTGGTARRQKLRVAAQRVRHDVFIVQPGVTAVRTAINTGSAPFDRDLLSLVCLRPTLS